MDLARRLFLSQGAKMTVGAAFVPLASVAQAGINDQPPRRGGDPARRYAMLIDLRRCIGCQACTVACHIENQTPLGKFRTIVSQTEVQSLETAEPAQFMLPRLCNHCDNPPCVPVCPVQATWQREDGIVVVDSDRCVGCAYCVQACPYDARFINDRTQTADKCTFCAHRLEAGLLPACVESCVGGARIIGDLNDPESQIARMVEQYRDELMVLQPDKNTRPHVFYLGMDARFVTRPAAEPSLWTVRNGEGEELGYEYAEH
ncbi:tetrathionate reductase subunit B [Brevirhabdus pacifica]|uniref:Tetrathionate reductase subunit B n=1 Tax=Brevirhabdus pacifica TaxID=1267768 RepID=A0A1U7DGP5_9RHOB|nr:4Fe-4S dicluster domain-containing protein [Brevirhabdus pacifica]APX89063.1 tetrathionate reductase subunit B [Brevirhabdus pacifica]OWU80270.1 tetrathionate reductase subunit B [Loktanella sp. 22II-4b]PJJ86360.1 tetrathionate reductase beta subunit [Brevirhabdus pacifica]